MVINEMIELEYDIRSGLVRVYELPSKRKDRYSSVAYANYLARHLEREYLRSLQGEEEDYAYVLT
jgi:hypothetical protein